MKWEQQPVQGEQRKKTAQGETLQMESEQKNLH